MNSGNLTNILYLSSRSEANNLLIKEGSQAYELREVSFEIRQVIPRILYLAVLSDSVRRNSTL